jgi:hypothetical protein
MQPQKFGLENVLRLVVDVCVQRKYAEKVQEEDADKSTGRYYVR